MQSGAEGIALGRRFQDTRLRIYLGFIQQMSNVKCTNSLESKNWKPHFSQPVAQTTASENRVALTCSSLDPS